MQHILLIAAGFGEWRAAWLEDGRAVELLVERGDIRPAGSIHLGRVVRRVAGLDAALVDIGEARPGFLPLRPAGPRYDEGAAVVVQVRREAQRGKGALLSAHAGDERAGPREPPVQLEPPPGFAAALVSRLPGAPDTVLCDDAAPLPELRTAFPEAEIAQRVAAAWPADLDALFDSALSPTAALRGGGAAHIEEGRAAVLIDIDTGSPETGSAARTMLNANLAAVAAVAREIRLRQLGGGIVIDFAALEGRRARAQVEQAMSAALAGDPARPRLLGWTRLGHLEIVRPRRLRSLAETMLEPGTARKNAVTLGHEALRGLYREARASPASNWLIRAAPEIAAALSGPAGAGLRALEDRLGRKVAVETIVAGEVPPFEIRPR